MNWKQAALLASASAVVALIAPEAWATSGTDIDAKYGTGMTILEGFGGAAAGLGVAAGVGGAYFHNTKIIGAGVSSVALGTILAKDRQILGMFNLGTALDGSSLLESIPSDPLTWLIDTVASLWTLMF